MADTIKTNLGPVTAYADAKAHGYTGTREEFGQLLAGAAGNLRDAVSAKEGAEGAKQAAETAQQAAAENQKNAGTHAENAKASADSAAEQANSAKASRDAAGESARRAEKAAQNTGGAKGTALSMPAIISFVDDDCRAEAYTLLWPVIQAKRIPYSLACPPGHLGESNYLTKEQLLTMVNGGCEVLSHHWREYAMTEFQTAEAYEADIQKTLTMLADLGVTNVRGVAYPNGYYTDSYMPVMRRYFDMGFTVERGINVPPVESCYMKRCEVFPTSGTYTLDDAKQLVDEVAASGGWLIFMTHAWYATFSAVNLTALIDYIAEKGVDIVGMNEGMDTIGNVVDIGYAHKPLNEMTTPYYLVDCLGRVYANTWNYTTPGTESRVEVTLPYHTGYTLTTSGATKANADTKRVISDKISAAAGERYLFCNLSAKYGNCFYVIYDANNAVLEYKGTEAASTGETLPDTEVTMPKNTAYFRLACDLGVNTTQFRAYKLTHTEAPASSSLPKGGTAGQVLVKKSDDDFDAEWTSKLTVLQTPLTGYTQDDLIGFFAAGLIIVDGEYAYWIDRLTNGVLSGTGYYGLTGKTYVFQKCRIKDGVFERIPESLVGLPSGGTAGQILAKNSSTVGDAQWIDPPAEPNILIGSESGNPVSVDDAFAAPLCGLHVYGKSTQDGTPTPDSPVPIVSTGDDGAVTIKVTGKNLFDINDVLTKANNYVPVGYTYGGDVNGDCLYLAAYRYMTFKVDLIAGHTYTVSLGVSAFTGSVTFSNSKTRYIHNNSTVFKIVLTENVDEVCVASNSTLTQCTVQIEAGSTATDYEPYQDQLLTLATPNGLPGIPVNSGGNYTDPQGQQWVCDEVDLERGVRVQNIRGYTFDGSEGWSADTNADYFRSEASNGAAYMPQIKNMGSGIQDTSDSNAFFEYGILGNNSATKSRNGFHFSYFWRFYLENKRPSNISLSNFIEWIKGKTVYYTANVPIETPLTSAEIAAYKSLVTYAPNTVVQASDGAGIKLDYQRDVNIAVKKLEDAIASMTTT